jgi:AcrR family transcriptional regulator
MPSTTAPVARKPAAERRAEIAAAAEAIARESGISAITMRAVASRIGIAPTLVVHHVSSMDALVADVFERIVGAELAEVVGIAEAVGDPARRLDAVLETVLDGSRAEVTLVWVEAWVLGRGNAELAERVRAQMDAWRGFLAGLIEAGAAVGAYRVADPLAVAGQLLGMIDGLNAHSLVGWQDDENRIELMLRAVDAMLGGVRAR